MKRSTTIISSLLAAVTLAASYVGVASAHVVVQPKQVETASFQTFTTGVPNEKDSAVTKLRLEIPSGLKYVQPTVKPGWTIDIGKQGDGLEAAVKEITWSGGSIPAGQRDDFTFSAQAPANATTLQWKAYQTYEDGTEVAWDQTPTAKESDDDSSNSGPYSETKVLDELPASQNTASDGGKDDSSRTTVALSLAAIALVLSVVALTSHRKRSADS